MCLIAQSGNQDSNSVFLVLMIEGSSLVIGKCKRKKLMLLILCPEALQSIDFVLSWFSTGKPSCLHTDRIQLEGKTYSAKMRLLLNKACIATLMLLEFCPVVVV